MPAPYGNQNARKAKIWRNAIDRALAAWPERCVSLEVNKGLDEAAYLFVNELMTKKDLGFFKEFGDRIDGKPAQAIIGGDEDDPAIRIESINVKLVRPE